MTVCGVCGNEYDKRVEVVAGGTTYNCAACAIRALAPACAGCGSKVIGYGVNARGELYWCALCARGVGLEELSALA